MLVATREVYLEKLLQLPRLIDAYQQGEVGFAAKATQWLRDLERSLGQLRSPLVSLASRQRARIIAAHDGFREPVLKNGKMSRRKEINATASLALGEVEKGLIERVQEIDQKFDAWRDKLAQFISVVSSAEPIPLPPTEPRRDWLQQIWQNWGKIEDTQAMYRYLNTVMIPGDRLYLLDELLENHMNSSGAQVSVSQEQNYKGRHDV